MRTRLNHAACRLLYHIPNHELIAPVLVAKHAALWWFGINWPPAQQHLIRTERLLVTVHFLNLINLYHSADINLLSCKASYQSAQVTGTPVNSSQPYYPQQPVQQQPMMSNTPVMSGYAQPVYAPPQQPVYAQPVVQPVIQPVVQPVVQPVYVQPMMPPMGYPYGYNPYYYRGGFYGSMLAHQLNKDLKDLF